LGSVGLNQNVFLCIAQSESSFNAAAMNQNGANMAVGVLQINDDNGTNLLLEGLNDFRIQRCHFVRSLRKR
jgi:hypothetical protein